MLATSDTGASLPLLAFATPEFSGKPYEALADYIEEGKPLVSPALPPGIHQIAGKVTGDGCATHPRKTVTLLEFSQDQRRSDAPNPRLPARIPMGLAQRSSSFQ
jgi:hypothetical protein